MNPVNKMLGQLMIGVLFLTLTIPIIQNTELFEEPVDPAIETQKVSQVLWFDRLPEIYLHVIFLGASIIASVLVLRKPPRERRVD